MQAPTTKQLQSLNLNFESYVSFEHLLCIKCPAGLWEKEWVHRDVFHRDCEHFVMAALGIVPFGKLPDGEIKLIDWPSNSYIASFPLEDFNTIPERSLTMQYLGKNSVVSITIQLDQKDKMPRCNVELRGFRYGPILDKPMPYEPG